MKAILVLEMLDEDIETIKELRADVRVDCYGEEYFVYRNMPLKPMPTTEQIKALLKKGYGFMSFEELLDEILGEQE